MTYEEFLAWCDEDTRAEWVKGEVIMVSPASRRHQALSDWLGAILGIYVREQELGEVITAPFQMKIGPHLPGREPDILFVAHDHIDRLKETFLDGPADLVVEIVSPESRLRDRGEKFAEYEMGEVQEYWLLDPDEQRADFYVLGTDGRYERRAADAQGIYRSAVVTGFWLRVAWLWQEPLPRVLAVLGELGIR
jgi:Uma2 family endonuclease